MGDKLGSMGVRNTPTCVGKLTCFDSMAHCVEKHPHVRGETQVAYVRLRDFEETPPRAWGNSKNVCIYVPTLRNTPTCVGKLTRFVCFQIMTKKHPHVRGETGGNR